MLPLRGTIKIRTIENAEGILPAKSKETLLVEIEGMMQQTGIATMLNLIKYVTREVNKACELIPTTPSPHPISPISPPGQKL